LKKRDMAILKQDKPRGILRADIVLGDTRHARYLPSPDLAPFVEHYWTVEWNLPAAKIVETLPHPSLHIVLEPGSAQLAGVHTARFTRVLEGNSRVFGVKFRPGGFRAFVDVAVSAYSNKTPALTDVFGSAAGTLEERVLMHTDHHAAIDVAEEFLRACHPVSSPEAELAAGIAGRIAADRSINKVEQVAQEYKIGVRRLQRLFADYVGVSPKWVIQRYRLHEAAERIATTSEPNWAAFALDLGYADQAHFIRDFKKLVGVTPADYFASRRGG
jgi:AraC-like DNA-binding protein